MATRILNRDGLFVLKYERFDAMNIRTGGELARRMHKFGIDSDHGSLVM